MSADMIGIELEGRYRLSAVLGSGGMGVVYLALDQQLQRNVAVKIMRLSSLSSTKRFERECQALAQVKSPLVPEIFCWGTAASGEAFMVMELVHGSTLEELLSGTKPSLAELKEIFVQVCDGLSVIHEHGLVHRDIKPANIMVHREDDCLFVKIMDFGIVHLLDQDEKLTATNDLVGSNGYFSPEHLTPSAIDARSDIFSLGCMMFRAYEGHLPFRAATPLASLMRMKSGNITRLSRKVPAEVATTIKKCLANSPEERFQSTSEVKDGLNRIPDQRVTSARKLTLSLCSAVALCILSVSIFDFAKQRTNKYETPFRSKKTLNKSIGKTEPTAKQRPEGTLPLDFGEKLIESVNKKDLSTVRALCSELTSLKPKRLAHKDLDALGSLQYAEEQAQQEKDIVTYAAILQAKRQYWRLKHTGAPRADLIGFLKFEDLLSSSHADSAQVDGLFNEFVQATTDSSDRKFILNHLAVYYERHNRWKEYERYMEEAIEVPPLDDSDRSLDLTMASQYRTYHNQNRSACFKLLLERTPEYQVLARNDNLKTEESIHYLQSMFFSSPLEKHEQLQWENLLKVVQEIMRKPKLPKKDLALYEIMEGALLHYLNHPDGISKIPRGLERAASLKVSGDLLNASVCLAGTLVPIPAPLLSKLLSTNPNSWLEHRRIDEVLAPYVEEKNVSTLLQLFNSSMRHRYKCLLPTIGRSLAILLAELNRSAESASVLSRMQSRDWYTASSAKVIASSYRANAAKKELRQLLTLIRGKDERTELYASVCLADLLKEPGESKERNRLISSPAILKGCDNVEIVNLLCSIYSHQANRSAFQALSQRVRCAKMPELDRARAMLRIAESAESIKDATLANQILQEFAGSQYVHDPDVAQHISNIYWRRENLAAIEQFARRLENDQKASQSIRDYVRSLQACMLSLKGDKQAADKQASSLLGSVAEPSDQILWYLAETLLRTGNIELMQKLVEKISPQRINIRRLVSLDYARLLARANQLEELKKVLTEVTAGEFWLARDIVSGLAEIYTTTKDLPNLVVLFKLCCSHKLAETGSVASTLISVLRDTQKNAPAAQEASELLLAFAKGTKNKELIIKLAVLHQQDTDLEAELALISELNEKNGFRTEDRQKFYCELLQLLMQQSRTKDMLRVAAAMGTKRYCTRSPGFEVVSHLMQKRDTANLRVLVSQMMKDQHCLLDTKLLACSALASLLQIEGDEEGADKLLKVITTCRNWTRIDPTITAYVLDIYHRRSDLAALHKFIAKLGPTTQPTTLNLARFFLAQCLSSAGRTAEFYSTCDQLGKEAITDQATAIRLADLYEERCDLARLRELYQSIKPVQSSRLHVGCRLARCLATMGRLAESRTAAADALQGTDKIRTLSDNIMLAHVYRSQQSLSDLQRLYNEVGKDEEELQLVCLVSMAEVLMNQGKTTESAKLFDKSLHHPALVRSPWCMYRLGEYFETSNDIQALSRLRSIAYTMQKSLGPRVLISLRLAKAMQAHRQYEEAERVLKSIDPLALRRLYPLEMRRLAAIYASGPKADAAKVEKLFNSLSPNGTTGDICARADIGITLAGLLLKTDKDRAAKLIGKVKQELSAAPSTYEEVADFMRKLDQLSAKSVKRLAPAQP
jgi:serine/threonine protein kinase